MIKQLFISPEYLEKAKELSETKSNFRQWSLLLGSIDDISLAASMKLLKKFKISFPRFLLHNIDYPLTLYRARIISPDSGEDISNPKTFSYPPVCLANSFQRANAPGYPVFYGALDGKTALEELRINGNEPIKKNDTVFLSEWKIKEGIKFNLANLTHKDIIADHQLYGEITKRVFSEIERIFKGEDSFFIKTQSFLFEEMSDLFLNGRYIQSGSIAHEILYNTGEANGIEINGILYPSCSNNFRSVNCALLPNFVDNALELCSIQKFTFNEFTSDGAKGLCSHFAEVKNGKIRWKSCHTELKVKDFSVELELEKKWKNEEVMAARFFLHNEEINLKDYCSERVEAIDLSDHKVKQEHLEDYKAGTEFIFLYILRLGKGVGNLKHKNKKNPVNKIIIKIPALGTTGEVSTHDVMI